MKAKRLLICGFWLVTAPLWASTGRWTSQGPYGADIEVVRIDPQILRLSMPRPVAAAFSGRMTGRPAGGRLAAGSKIRGSSTSSSIRRARRRLCSPLEQRGLQARCHPTSFDQGAEELDFLEERFATDRDGMDLDLAVASDSSKTTLTRVFSALTENTTSRVPGSSARRAAAKESVEASLTNALEIR